MYITGINIHDDNLNVIMRANLAQPIKKKEDEGKKTKKEKVLQEYNKEKLKVSDKQPDKQPDKQIKEVKDELKKEKDLIKKKPEESIGILDRLVKFFTKFEDKTVSDKSYIPLDKATKDLIKVSREELNELRNIEKKLTEQLRLDKVTMNQYKAFLNKQLVAKYNKLDRVERDIKHKKRMNKDKIDNLNEQLDIAAKDKLKFLDEKERIINSKLLREKNELDEIRNSYIDKLNKTFNREYKRMKKQYDSRLKKQQHILKKKIDF